MTDLEKSEILALSAEIARFFTQMSRRYSSKILESTFGEDDKNRAANLLNTIRHGGVEATEFKALREWLKRGVKCFDEYPPGPESLIQLCTLVKQYPITEHTEQLTTAWYRLDTEYSQYYGRQWKGDGKHDALVKERVWLAKFEELEVTAPEILQAMSRISQSGFFRTYVPKFEEFVDTIYAIRCSDAPMVEEAWAEAVMGQAAAFAHPAVRRARGHIGAHDLRTRGYDRDVEQRFKSAYRNLLLNPELIEEYEDEPEKPTATYMGQDELVGLLRK